MATPLDMRPAKHVAVKTIGQVWQEWEFGIGGNKAVKEWKDSEHTTTTYKRNALYFCLRNLVNAGYSSATAISKVERECSGWNSILKISADIKRRTKNGTLPPSLRI